MESIATLSTGTKLLLASATLLFLDLFFTWQNLPQYYGKFHVTASLDGWDRMGLFIGLLTLALIALVVVRLTDLELSPDVPWNAITIVVATLVVTLTVLKNVTDAHSAWAAYAGVLLAVGTVAGAYLDRALPSRDPKPITRGDWKPRIRASAAPEQPPARTARAAGEPEPGPAQPAARW
jgi:hypothetical protein